MNETMIASRGISSTKDCFLAVTFAIVGSLMLALAPFLLVFHGVGTLSILFSVLLVFMALVFWFMAFASWQTFTKSSYESLKINTETRELILENILIHPGLRFPRRVKHLRMSLDDIEISEYGASETGISIRVITDHGVIYLSEGRSDNVAAIHEVLFAESREGKRIMRQYTPEQRWRARRNGLCMIAGVMFAIALMGFSLQLIEWIKHPSTYRPSDKELKYDYGATGRMRVEHALMVLSVHKTAAGQLPKKLPPDSFSTTSPDEIMYYSPKGFPDNEGKLWLIVYGSKEKPLRYTVGRLKDGGAAEVKAIPSGFVDLGNAKQ